MTFDTWWKEQGSLHPDIFSLPFDSREVFKRIAQTAWEESERVTTEELSDFEEECIKLEERIDVLKEELSNSKQATRDALDDIDTLKDSIRSCL